MLIAAAIAFAFGLYLQALNPLPAPYPAIGVAFGCLSCLALIKRLPRGAAAALLVAFVFAGMVRMSLVARDDGVPLPSDGYTTVRGTVQYAAPSSVILKLSHPPALAGEGALFRPREALRVGDDVVVFGTLRHLAINFKNPHILSWRWVKRLEGVSIELRGEVLSRREDPSLIARWRQFFSRRIDQSGAPAAAILKALTIGDTTGIDESTKALFLRTGTSHILAISGSNVAIICAFFFFISRFLIGRLYRLRLRGDDTRYAALATIPFAFLFMLLAGAGIPLIRATIMVTVFMLALFFERQRDLLATTFISALVILTIYPHSLFTASFQLTFVSVLSIVIFSQKLGPFLAAQPRLWTWFLSMTGITAAAAIGTLPVVLYHFYGFNPFAVIHNIIAVPLMCIAAMPVALVGLVMPYGEVLVRAGGCIVRSTITFLSYLDFGYFYPVVRPLLIEALLYYSVIICLVNLRYRVARAALLFVLVPALMAQAYAAWSERFDPSKLCVSFIDVGLGDSMLVEAPGGLRMLIDGGGFYGSDFDTGKAVITPLLLSKKIMSLDYVVSTHPHGDHIGGLLTVVRDFPVRHLVVGGYFPREQQFLRLIGTAADRGIPIDQWSRGDRFGLPGGPAVEVLNPDREVSYDNANDASLALRLRFGETSFLLTADIGEPVELQLLRERFEVRSQVIKVPHHGSRYSSSPPFIEAVSPILAVLSVGRGIPGLPSPEALERYRDHPIPMLRTDRDGLVRVCTTGRSLTYSTTAKAHGR